MREAGGKLGRKPAKGRELSVFAGFAGGLCSWTAGEDLGPHDRNGGVTVSRDGDESRGHGFSGQRSRVRFRACDCSCPLGIPVAVRSGVGCTSLKFRERQLGVVSTWWRTAKAGEAVRAQVWADARPGQRPRGRREQSSGCPQAAGLGGLPTWRAGEAERAGGGGADPLTPGWMRPVSRPSSGNNELSRG